MRNVFAVITTACLVVSLAAQPQQPPAFRTVTDLVEVDVVVQDRSGAFVSDLQPADFTVLEDGRPQHIDLFYPPDHVDLPATTTAAGPASTGSAAAASGGSSSRGRLFVAFFDEDHLSPSGFKRVQAAASSLFAKHFAPGDLGGVVENGRMANNRLTSSRDELLKAVRDAKPTAKPRGRRMDEQLWPRLSTAEAIRIVVHDDSAVFAQAVERACGDEPSLCRTADVSIRSKATQLANDARADTAQTGQQLLAVLNGLAQFEGRKTVLLFSEGFFADESWPLVKDAIGQAARANARFYTFDARGLDRTGMSDRLSGTDPGGSDALARLLAASDPAGDAVNSLAVDTGGFVIRNANVFDRAIQQLAADATTYYLLGYRPDRPFDGGFRRLTVKVNRPGVIVRARRGYSAVPRPVSMTAAGATPADPAIAPKQDDVKVEDTSPATAPAAPEPTSTASATPTESRTIRVRPDVEAHIRTLGPTGRDPDGNAGWEAYQRGDVESARRLLAVAAARPAAAPWVFYALGQSAYALREYSEAASAWEHVRETVPEFEPVYFDLVDAYLQQKDYDRATRTLHAAEQRWTSDAEVMNALGVVQVARGALDDAVGSFERAITSAPRDPIGYFNLAKATELRYWKHRRYNNRTGQWLANENDRRKAAENYTRYLRIGGPLENAAREALSRLNWATPQP